MRLLHFFCDGNEILSLKVAICVLNTATVLYFPSLLNKFDKRVSVGILGK